MDKELKERFDKALKERPFRLWLRFLKLIVIICGSAVCAFLLIAWLGKAFWKVLNLII